MRFLCQALVLYVAMMPLSACIHKDKPISPKPPAHYNICILLDLSDRILLPQQPNKDLAILSGILNLFGEIVRKKGFVRSRDALQVYVANQPGSDIPIDVSGRLTIDVSKIPPAEKVKNIPELRHSFENALIELYRQAPAIERFNGADIWSFFKNSVNTFVVRNSGEGYNNYLIILTDGYIEFARTIMDQRPREANRTSYTRVSYFSRMADWEKAFDSGDHGLIAFGRDYSELQVMVLEVHPRRPKELDIIRKYWLKWFREMSINVDDLTMLETQDDPNRVVDQVRRFLQKQ